MQARALGIALLLIGSLVGCGGATSTELDSVNPNGGAAAQTATSGGTPAPSTNPTTLPPSGTPPPTQGCTMLTFYRDDDGDGFGGTKTKSACTAPDDRWITKGGDCDDDRKDVFPGQTAYFHESYTDANGKASFDYDCSGKEEQSPPPRKAAGTCAVAPGGVSCTGEGYLPPLVARSPSTGSDPLCGAARYQACKLFGSGVGNTTCQPVVSNDVTPTSCR